MYMKGKHYESPRLELLDIYVEGAILSGSVDVDDWGNGGYLGGGEADEAFL